MSEQTAGAVTVEATGETVGEAKWKALRELERLTPSLDKAAVRFQVLSEGERGLLGVGYTPARVLASVEATAGGAGTEPEEAVDESEAAARVRGVLTHVTTALGIRCRVDIAEDDEGLTATCSGDELGLLIGKHGATIDAVQVLAGAIASRGAEDRVNVVVDAAGYRDRRRRALEAVAVRSAEEALREGTRVELEPMSAAERRLVHERLKDYEGVSTVSEGEEPNRYIVVEPLDDWLRAVVATPGLTALDLAGARRVLLDDSLRAAELVGSFEGPIVDVGSGGGAPGIPLAHALPGREVVLLEAERRKCEFLERWAPENARVVWGRAEEQKVDWAGVAMAKALAPPPVAAEWCLPLVREGGAVVLWVGESADHDRVAKVAGRLAAEPADGPPGLLVLRKLGPTPAGFPRRTGVARRRPLA